MAEVRAHALTLSGTRQLASAASGVALRTPPPSIRTLAKSRPAFGVVWTH